jgi:hypothetical protein
MAKPCRSRPPSAAVLAFARFPRDVREVSRLLRIRYVDDRRAVLLVLAGQGISLHAAVMADVGNPAVALALERRILLQREP